MKDLIKQAVSDIKNKGFVTHKYRVILENAGVDVDALEERHKQSPKE